MGAVADALADVAVELGAAALDETAALESAALEAAALDTAAPDAAALEPTLDAVDAGELEEDAAEWLDVHAARSVAPARPTVRAPTRPWEAVMAQVCPDSEN